MGEILFIILSIFFIIGVFFTDDHTPKPKKKTKRHSGKSDYYYTGLPWMGGKKMKR